MIGSSKSEVLFWMKFCCSWGRYGNKRSRAVLHLCQFPESTHVMTCLQFVAVEGVYIICDSKNQPV